MTESLQEARARLTSHFADNSAAQPDRWAALWDKGDFLPWDRGKPNPALIDVLADQQDLIGACVTENGPGDSARKRALVPGCGRGYDVLLLASFGYDAFGLEVSQTAIQRCLEEQKTNRKNYPVRNEASGAGKAVFINGDFFSDDWVTEIGEEKIDLVYDYTFLSALPPTLRPSWARRMTDIVAIDGCLICVEFPSAKDPKLGGPPYALPPTVYLQHLSRPGEVLSYGEDGHIVKDETFAVKPGALQRIAHWQPDRTHEIGQGHDWISIWRRRRLEDS